MCLVIIPSRSYDYCSGGKQCCVNKVRLLFSVHSLYFVSSLMEMMRHYILVCLIKALRDNL